jgi:hypothetical protein
LGTRNMLDELGSVFKGKVHPTVLGGPIVGIDQVSAT